MNATQLPNWDWLRFIGGNQRRDLARALRAEKERKRKHRFRRERCFARFRVLHLDQLRALPLVTSRVACGAVYFLWDGPRLVYIGKSINALQDRVLFHRRDGKHFTHATYEQTNSSCARWCESQYLMRYPTKLNQQRK